MRKLLPLLLLALSVSLVLDRGPVQSRAGRRRPRPKPKPAQPTAKVDPSLRIIVQLKPPKPIKKGAKKKPTTAPVPRFRRYRRYGAHGSSRRSTTLYLRVSPEGDTVMALPIGVKVRVLKAGKTHTKVETAGMIRVTGYVPNVVLGLRVQDKAKLYGRPGGKPIGEVARSHLVHLERYAGQYAKVRLMGYLPVTVYMKRKDLGVAATRYGGRLTGSYPGGSAMTVSAGKIHATANGPVVAQAMDEGKVYRVRVLGRWSQIAVYDYGRVQLRGWVPTERLSWRNSPWYGGGYRQHNCRPGTSGNNVALSEFKLYAARDDAWPTIRIMPNARFNVVADKNGWVRISSYSCLTFTGYAEDRPGDWTSTYLRHR